MRLREVVVPVEEVEADPGGAGDGAEVDLLLGLDERADRGLGAGDGGLPLGLGGLAERVSTALAGGCARAGHGVSGLLVMAMAEGPASW